jgi:hypothetical protein
MATTQRRRLAVGVLAGGLLLLPLAACGNQQNTGSSALSSASSIAASASSAAGSAAQAAGNAVDCSGRSCSLTLSGNARQADVLGTTISLGGVQNGQATLGIGNHTVTCGQGDQVSAGSLKLTCTTISQDSVSLTASLG